MRPRGSCPCPARRLTPGPGCCSVRLDTREAAMKRMMIALAVAILMASPAAATDCGDPGETGTQAWLDYCLLALADDSAFEPKKPSGPGWFVAKNQPCHVWLWGFFWQWGAPSRVTWSGACLEGKASGAGKLTISADRGTLTSSGSMSEGRPEGTWHTAHPSSPFSATYQNGILNGPYRSSYQGSSSVIEYRDGKNMGGTGFTAGGKVYHFPASGSQATTVGAYLNP